MLTSRSGLESENFTVPRLKAAFQEILVVNGCGFTLGFGMPSCHQTQIVRINATKPVTEKQTIHFEDTF
jgi:hypothetical protein